MLAHIKIMLIYGAVRYIGLPRGTALSIKYGKFMNASTII
ncbi:hypothetical protein APHMUC_1192 [Anaplasma phagocytophilum str. ApMUC09]|uniref:Uncharacterized protein n=1 Tax=Anaplasma phagocytophilum str. ApMUC09 TaxID=1359152 RepID=A0A0F3N949_ANAPH|nr:hypothetical protein APHMUC_1192 [Anaplasma phagocytophilum str. ApMUC09]